MREKLQIGLGILGVGLLIAGGVVALRQAQGKSENEVVITESTEKAEGTEVIVDVGGAVEKPGVYQLPADARVNDALIAAGGLGAAADRVWVARYLNLAQIVVDGAKIYIPRSGEGVSSSQLSVDSNIGQISGAININTASQSELDSLWGIGEKRAADIIANRPYQSIGELMSKAGIPKNIYEKIKDKIIVY